MSELTLELRGDRESYQPGEVVEGVARWSSDVVPRLVEVRLSWHVSGRGTREIMQVDAAVLTDPAASGELAFRFTLPNGPYSFSGRLLSLRWVVSALLEHPEADEVQRVPIVLSATGEETRLVQERRERAAPASGTPPPWVPRMAGRAVWLDLLPALGPVTRSSSGRLRKLIRSLAWSLLVTAAAVVAGLWALDSRAYSEALWYAPAGLSALIAVVCLLLWGQSLHALLALLSPRVEITLERAATPLDEPLRIRWRVLGDAGRLRGLSVMLEGVERVSYRPLLHSSFYYRRRVVEESLFLKTSLVRCLPAAGHGEASIDLPAGAAHSFEAEHNQIRWLLRVRGDVRSRPDIDDVFDIVVLPARMPADG